MGLGQEPWLPNCFHEYKYIQMLFQTYVHARNLATFCTVTITILTFQPISNFVISLWLGDNVIMVLVLPIKLGFVELG